MTHGRSRNGGGSRGPIGRPKRSLGQNFLVDPNTQRRIVRALAVEAADEVLEIGPGRGALTRHLVQLGVRLVAVELDDELADGLEAEALPGLRVVRGDALALPLHTLVDDWSRAKVVGNIPYNVTSPLIFKLLEPPRPADIVLMVQAEVAERITAAPGVKAYGALSVGVQTAARAERLFSVPRTVFRPVPSVDSAVVRLTPEHPGVLDPSLSADVRTLTRAAFGWRRKQLATTLRKHRDYGIASETINAMLAELGLAPTVRPEQLSPSQFVRLARMLAESA